MRVQSKRPESLIGKLNISLKIKKTWHLVLTILKKLYVNQYRNYVPEEDMSNLCVFNKLQVGDMGDTGWSWESLIAKTIIWNSVVGNKTGYILLL